MDFSSSYKKNVSLLCTPEYLVIVTQTFVNRVFV